MLQTDSLKQTAITLLHDVHTWRCIIAVAAIVTMMLPWTYLDGSRHPLTGADLIAYTFTGSERGAMAGHSVLAALALLVTPMVTLALSILVFARIYQGQQPVILNAVTGCLPVLILVFAGSITSSERLIGPGWAAPQVGIILGFLCQATLAVHTLVVRYQQEQRDTRKAQGDLPQTEGPDPAQPTAPVPAAVNYHRMENPDVPRSLLRQPTAVATKPDRPAAPPQGAPEDRMPVRVTTQPGEAKWPSGAGSPGRRKHGRTRRPDQRRHRERD